MMGLMEPLRTQKGKLYGMLDISAYILHIKDGSNTRLIRVPSEGLELQYISGSGQAETIIIPPEKSFIKI